MTIEIAGFNFGSPVDVGALIGGTDTAVADGDWIFWGTYYDNTRTIALTDPTGWTLLRKTVGTLGTIELWRYHWSTGDPTTWALTFGGSGGVRWGASVVRGVIATPNILSATHETTSAPVLIDAITNSAIKNNDVAMLIAAVNIGTVQLPASALNSFTSGISPNLAVSFQQLTVGGSAPSWSLSMNSGTPTELFGLQLILHTDPLGGWGVGQVRMGAN
jgi:hypothetical protein